MSFPISEKRAALWKELTDQGFVSSDVPTVDDIESPWYVRLLIGFSGWLAALFFLGFLGVGFEFVYNNNVAGFIVGAIMIFAAYQMLLKKSDSDFSSQFALAISFSGQALVVFSLDLFKWFSAADSINWIVLASIQAALAWFMPNSIHRLWSAFAAIMAFTIALTVWHVYFIQTPLIMAAVAVVWLNEFKWIDYQNKLKPIAYGITLALLYQASTGIFHLMLWNMARYKERLMQPWVTELLSGFVILYVVYALLKRLAIKIPGRTANIALIGAVILTFVSLKMFGLTIGVMIILLGYANGNRILTGLGISSLLYFMSAYYYTLHTTLLVKSEWLALLGVLLIIASVLMRRVLFANREG